METIILVKGVRAGWQNHNETIVKGARCGGGANHNETIVKGVRCGGGTNHNETIVKVSR